MPSLCKHKPMQTPSGHCRCEKTQTPSRHEPKTAQTASQKTVSRYLWNPHIKQSLEPQSTSPAYANTSLCKHHLDTADAKRPKHHLDTSRKPPKPQAKKLFHVTFGIHIKQSLEPQSTCPAYANTIWNHIKQLWSHRAHAQPMQTPSGHCRCKKTQTPRAENRPNRKPKNCFTLPLESTYKSIFGATEHKPSLCKHKPMQTPSGHCRCKKTQTPSRHEPKTEPQAKKLFHVTFGIHIKQSLEPQSTCPAYANTSLCKHHLDTADAKRPKHHLDTSRKPPKPQAKKLFHVTFGIHIKQSLEPQSTCPAYANTSLCKHHLDTADAKRPKHHLDTSRKPP